MTQTAKVKNKIIEGKRLAVLGKTGTGKSYFVKKKLIPQLVKHKPVFIFDRKEEYAGKFAIDHSNSWFSYDGIDHLFSDFEQLKIIYNSVFVINCQSDRDYILVLSFFEDLQQPVSILLDEAHDIYLSSDFYKAKEKVTKIARYGRSFGIDLTLISNRTLDVPPDIRTQIDCFISFYQAYKGDIKALEGEGFDKANKILDLDKRKFEIYGEVPNHLSF